MKNKDYIKLVWLKLNFVVIIKIKWVFESLVFYYKNKIFMFYFVYKNYISIILDIIVLVIYY